MHIAHLAMYPDLVIAVLLDITDDSRLLEGNSRDARLAVLWRSYRAWCEGCHVADRAARKLFLTSTLRGNGDKYQDVSQKVLSAAAARYLMLWLASLMKQFSQEATPTEDDLFPASISSLLSKSFLRACFGRLAHEEI